MAEEVLVYPEVDRKVSAEEVEHAREEHAEAEKTLQRLEKLDADDPAFDDELATLMAEIRHHIEDEEGEMFAHMRQVIDTEELRKLGARVEAFKKVAPTRPRHRLTRRSLDRRCRSKMSSQVLPSSLHLAAGPLTHHAGDSRTDRQPPSPLPRGS